MIKNFIKKFKTLVILIQYTDFIFTALINLVLLTFILFKRREFTRVVLMESGGFGHTIQISQIINFLYKNEKILFIILNEKKRFNKEIKKLFINPEIIFLRRCLITSNYLLTEITARIIEYYINKLFVINEFILSTDHFQRSLNIVNRKSKYLYHELIKQKQYYLDKDLITSKTLLNGSTWVVSYFKLLTIQQEFLISIYNRSFKNILKKKLKSKKPIVVIYYRQKKHWGIDEYDTRCGGDIKNYSQIIDYLINKNYQVFGVGDVSGLKNFNDKLLIYDDFNIDKNYFDLASIFLAEKYIGNNGGGNHIAHTLGIPCLTIDCFPLYVVFPYHMILYKSLLISGKKIKFDNCLSDYMYPSLYDQNIEIIENSWFEIKKSLKLFISIKNKDWISYIKENQTILQYPNLSNFIPSVVVNTNE